MEKTAIDKNEKNCHLSTPVRKLESCDTNQVDMFVQAMKASTRSDAFLSGMVTDTILFFFILFFYLANKLKEKLCFV